MKKVLIAILAIATLGVAASAYAEEVTSNKSGYYVRGELGGHESEANGFSYKKWHKTKTIDYGSGDGVVAAIAAGKEVYPNVRTEVELEYKHADLDVTVPWDKDPVDGDVEQYSAGVNALYDLKDTNDYVDFFAGAGVGVMNTHIDAPKVSGSDATYFYKLIGGVSREIDEDWAVQAAYTYQDGQDYKVDGRSFGNRDQSIKFGLTRKF